MSSFYCYRFNSEAQFLAFAEEEGLIAKDGSPILASHEHALDILGTIYEGGTYDAEGVVITPPTALSGWHVNYIGEPPDGWEEFLVTPQHPARVWA